MGVQGLWKLLEPTGRPVTLESLQGKILAIDLSLWIHQAIRGCAGSKNEKNAHLIVLYRRIAKLMFYGIRPICVFDGPDVPQFKKQTLTKRRMKQDSAAQKLPAIKRKILRKLLKDEILSPTKSAKLDDDTKKSTPEKMTHSPSEAAVKLEANETSDEDEFDEFLLHPDEIPSDFDVSNDFGSMPANMQREILLNLRENAKQSRRFVELPKDSNDFSNFQLKNLLKKSRISQKLKQVERNLVAHESLANVNLPNDAKNNYVVKNVFHGDRRRHVIFQNVAGESEVRKNGSIKSKSQEETSEIEEDHVRPVQGEELLQRNYFLLNSTYRPENGTRIEHFSNPNGKISPSSNPTGKIDVISLEDAGNEEKSQATSKNWSSFDAEDTESQEIQVSQVEESEIKIFEEDSPLETSNLPKNASKGTEMSGDSDDDFSFVEVPTMNPSDLIYNFVPGLHMPSTCMEETCASNSPPEKCKPGKETSIGLEEKEEPFFVACASEILDVAHRTDEDVFPCTSSTVKTGCVCEKVELDGAGEKFNEVSFDSEELESESRSLEDLRSEYRKMEGVDKKLTSQLMEECETLLKLFGLPIVKSRGEAEAECASLESTGLTMGTVTDDSDVWLFGGRTVYRHVFDKKRFVHKYESKVAENLLGLSRRKLILLALLVGCDYTAGVKNAGVVAAMEILSEFSAFNDEKVGILKEFKNWFDECQTKTTPPGNSVRGRLCKLPLIFPSSFPDEAVFSAFLTPNVLDTRVEKFEWKPPDVEELRRFALVNFNWSKEKVDELLLPAVRHAASQQTKITNFTFSLKPEAGSDRILQTTRIRDAVEKLKSQTTATNTPKKTKPKKRGKQRKAKRKSSTAPANLSESD